MIETAGKEKQLKNLEDTIRKNLELGKNRLKQTMESWFEVGRALWKIRENKLHPQPRFENYCVQQWGFKRSHAFALCRAYEVWKEHKKSDPSDFSLKDVQKISFRAQKALTGIPEEQQAEVLEEAKDTGKVTGPSIKAAAVKKRAAAKPVSKPEQQKDTRGTVIPERCLPIWNRRNDPELREKLHWLNEFKQWATDMQGTEDIFWNVPGFSLNTLILQIGELRHHLKQAVPEVVCTTCQGVTSECELCHGRGMIPEHLATKVGLQVLEMRDKLSHSNDSAKRLSSASC